jgi:hypothetical protein
MDIKTQFRNIAPIMVMLYAFTTAVLTVVIFLGIEHGIELDHFTQDPSTIMKAPFYLGFFSYVGILFWAGTATLCFFVRYILPDIERFRQVKKFMLASGLLTLLMMSDDLFLLHEDVFPNYLNIQEGIVYIIYVNVILIYIYSFRFDLLNSEFLILLAAFGLIGISQFVDELPMPIPEDSFLEDAVKLFGVMSWFLYYTRYSIRALREAQ